MQPPSNPAAAVELPAFVGGLAEVAALLEAGGGAAAAGTGGALQRAVEQLIRPALEEAVPPKYWAALVHVKRAVAQQEDLQALLRRNALGLRQACII